MATDFSYENKTVNAGGPVKPSGKNMPGDPRTRVNTFADIASIPVPYVGMIITVLQDETNSGKMTDYKVKSLKANSLGSANSLVDEVVRYVDYLGASSGGSVSQEDINTAVNNYLTQHPVQSGATAEQAAQIEANKTAIGDNTSGLVKEVNDIKNTELKNLNTAIQTLETLVGLDESLGDKSGLPAGDTNIIASINRIDAKPTVTSEEINNAVNSYFIEHPSADGVFLTKVLTTEEITAILGSAPVVPTDVEVQSIVIVNNHFEVNVGESVQLEYTILPSNATDKTITWSTSNSSVATVSNTGLVTTKAEGSALITATSSNGKTATAEVIASVVSEVVDVTGLTLSEETLNLNIGDVKTLNATIIPSNATNKSISWSSSNKEVATVVNGKVTGLQIGEAIITATSVGNESISSACTITVSEAVTITSVRSGLVGEYNFTNLSGDTKEVYALNDETKKITFNNFNDISTAKTSIGISADNDNCIGLCNSSGISDKATIALTIFLKEHKISSGLFKIGDIAINSGNNGSGCVYSCTSPSGFLITTNNCLESNKYISDVLTLVIDKNAPLSKIYVNGKLKGTSSNASITSLFTNTLKVMSGFGSWQRSSNLVVSNALVYNRILEDNEIETISNEIRKHVILDTSNSYIKTSGENLFLHYSISNLSNGVIKDYIQEYELTPTSTTSDGFLCNGSCGGLYIPNSILLNKTLSFKAKLSDGYLLNRTNNSELSFSVSGQNITSVLSNEYLADNKTFEFNKDVYSLVSFVLSTVDNTSTLKLYINSNKILEKEFQRVQLASNFIVNFNNTIAINEYVEYNTNLSDSEIASLVKEMGCE